MTKNIIFALILLLLSSSSYSCRKENADSQPNGDETSVLVPFGDPFIMLWQGKYYAYGTASPDGIAVFVSDDLQNWTVPKGPINGLALNKSDVWADRWFWAPEVYAVNGKFYMYYSADEHICVATSDSPLGPFRQEVQKPMIESEKCIDNSLFIDDDGKPYLFFDRFDDGLNICVAELENNLIDIKPETIRKCIHVSQPWEEVWPRVNEGSFVLKRNGVYYMTYSANSYESQMYGVGVATATNIAGPWIKYANNPILQKPGKLVGVGHSAMFTDKQGKLRIVFHAHNSATQIHPRHMYISIVTFENKDGKEIMVIDKNYITPVMKTN
jgi:beta-xylosidase